MGRFDVIRSRRLSVEARVRWSVSLILVSVVLFAAAAAVQLGRDAESLVAGPAVLLLALAAATLAGGITALVLAFAARRRARRRLGL